MKHTKDMQDQMNIIQTVLLNGKEFECLEHFIGEKADVVYAQPSQVIKELSFCMDSKDMKTMKEISPNLVKFVKHI